MFCRGREMHRFTHCLCHMLHGTFQVTVIGYNNGLVKGIVKGVYQQLSGQIDVRALFLGLNDFD